MSDPEGLVEFSVYTILVALALPFIQVLTSYSPTLVTAISIVAIAPIPMWLVGFRTGMPNWLSRIITWNCWLALICLLLSVIFVASAKLFAA